MNSIRLLGTWPWPLGFAIAIAVAAIAWWLYWRETRSLANANRWLLPLLRAAAIFLLLLTFLEPVIHHRVREGNPGRITFLIDGSQSMSVADDPEATAVAPRSRFERAANLLLRNEQLSLEKLAEEFEISIRRIENGQTLTVWESSTELAPELPETSQPWLPPSWSNTTALGEAILQSRSAQPESNGATSSTQPSEQSSQKPSAQASTQSVVVLLTDGQNNAGILPVEAAKQMDAGQPLFTVGYGATAEAIDLAVESIDCPPRVFKSDTLRGTLLLKDRIGKGKKFNAMLMVADEVVWTQKLSAENLANRRVEFTLPVAKLYELLQKQMPQNVKYAVMPLQITAKVSSDIRESNEQNNSRSLGIAVAAQRSRILLLDGRSRWESRYLRNMFDRDPAWQVESQIANEPSDFHFPATREELFQYDLVVLGDLPASLLSREQIVWLREFVEVNGGGLILISGSMQHLAQPGYAELQKLFPVSWKLASASSTAQQRLTKKVSLTSAGQSLAALRIDTRGDIESQTLWSQLPELQFVDKVKELPGAEVLATATSSVESQPLFVTRRFGAGRVFFCASDETWRFRYKLADVVHQRLWNQLARWIMRTPMAVQGEFVSLDCGAASYPEGKNISVRAQLRDRDGRPASGKSPIALFIVDEKLVARVPLIEDPNVPATYSADVSSLPPGNYDMSLEAAGFSREALDVHTNFSIVGTPSVEMQNIACDNQSLRELAELSGGKYLAETEADQLFPLLRPLSSGRFVESDTILWQTYWWFTIAVTLLVAEWWLRKRAGLI